MIIKGFFLVQNLVPRDCSKHTHTYTAVVTLFTGLPAVVTLFTGLPAVVTLFTGLPAVATFLAGLDSSAAAIHLVSCWSGRTLEGAGFQALQQGTI